MWPYFERLRAEDPVHWAVSHFEEVGGYWSVTKYNDIMAVDTNHEVFSSEPTIVLPDPAEDFTLPMFIAMDPPKHDIQRKTISPIVAGPNLARLEPVIRERAAVILDTCPIGEEFDWVDKVSIELTTMTLATLFDFPWEDRRKLTRWSDVTTAAPNSGHFSSTDPEIAEAERRQELFECVDYFMRLWNERVNAPPQPDLISMLAHGEATRDMDRMEYLGNLILLIVGGNDTTRNTITGAQPVPRPVRQAEAVPGAHPLDGVGDDPLADAARLHAPPRQTGLRTRRQDHPRRRQAGHVVRLGQP
jgi:cytochrome P450